MIRRFVLSLSMVALSVEPCQAVEGTRGKCWALRNVRLMNLLVRRAPLSVPPEFTLTTPRRCPSPTRRRSCGSGPASCSR